MHILERFEGILYLVVILTCIYGIIICILSKKTYQIPAVLIASLFTIGIVANPNTFIKLGEIVINSFLEIAKSI